MAADATRRRTRVGRIVLHKHRLPPPHTSSVARTAAAGAVGPTVTGGYRPDPVLQALVSGAPVGRRIYSFDDLYARGSAIRDDYCSLCYRRSRSQLAQVSLNVSFLSILSILVIIIMDIKSGNLDSLCVCVLIIGSLIDINVTKSINVRY